MEYSICISLALAQQGQDETEVDRPSTLKTLLALYNGVKFFVTALAKYVIKKFTLLCRRMNVLQKDVISMDFN